MPNDAPALLLIDVQQAFDEPYWGPRNNPDAEARIADLLSAWRDRGLPVIHVRHDSTEVASTLRPDRPGNCFKPEGEPRPGELVVPKSVNSAFIGTGLEAHLRAQGLQRLVIAGISTNHCVSTTTRMAGNLGFDVTVVSDACFTFDCQDGEGGVIPADTMHRVGLAELRREFASIRSTREVLAMLPT